jgi:hypothetical protein
LSTQYNPIDTSRLLKNTSGMFNTDLGLETLETPIFLPKIKTWQNQKLNIPWNSPWKVEQTGGNTSAT